MYFFSPRIALVYYFTCTIVLKVYLWGFPLLIMPISNMQWREEVGIFNATSKTRYLKKRSLRIAALVFYFFSFGFRSVFIILFLFACGDIEFNSSPKNMNSCYNFSICHWNLNSITGHNFAKVNLLQAYNAIDDSDMICLS